MSGLVLTEVEIYSGTIEEYVIYGTGEIGRMLKKTLQLLNQKVQCFVCSDGYKKEQWIDGLPVMEISDYLQKEKKHTILLTVQRGALAIVQNLQKGNLAYCQINSLQDVYKVYQFFYENYFSKKGVDLQGEYLTLNGIDFLNPFCEDISYSLAFFMECGDLILPAIYQDLSCIHEGSYEVKNVKIEQDDVVIDCGSNMGLFSAVVANRCRKVYAFEPVLKTQEYIRRIIQKYINIVVCNYALGDYTGTAMFTENIDTNYANHIVEKADEMIDGTEVNIITIDEFVKQNNLEKVDFIKADIEGAERYMLKGARETLRKFAPKLSICEYHLPDDPAVLEEIILEANSKYIVKHENMKLYAYVPKK